MTDRLRILALFGGGVLFGQERANIEVLTALKECGHEVLCLVRDEEWSRAVPEMLQSSGLAWQAIPYIGQLEKPVLWFLVRNLGTWTAANAKFIRVVREFRPTHVHAFNQLYVLNFLPALVITRTPMVYNAGDKPTLHRMLWVLVWRFIVARSVRIAAISHFIAMELEKSGVRRSRIEVIYSRPPKRRGSERGPELPFDNSTLKIVFVGQVIPGKGLDLLIEAFRDLAPSFPAARILVAGRVSDWPGDQWARDLRDRTGRDPVLASKVAFLGFVENIPALLQSVEILVAPSLLEEALGLVVMEAKAAGRPAIVFPSGGLPEMIEPDVDGIVCRDKSVEALAEALRRYLDDPLLARRHGAAALQSLDRLGVSDFAERWSKLYESTW